MFAVPNGGYRAKATARRLKLTGVRAGVPDIVLPVARGGHHGLFIEMKTADGRLSPDQKRFIAFLQAQGYATAVCHGNQQATDTIERYLEMPKYI